MSYPDTPKDIYEYENMFDYSVWTPNTTVHVTNVPWDATYRDVVRFNSVEDRDAYFASLSESTYSFNLNGMVYLRYGEPIRVNCPFSMINQLNYLVVKNPIQPVPTPVYSGNVPPRKPDTFYYFINDAQYIAPNTTQLNVQLDVWMTYYNQLDWGLCYINKGHIGIANENSTLENLSDYLTDAEGLNIGDEYAITDLEITDLIPSDPYYMIVATCFLDGDLGTIQNPSLTSSAGQPVSGFIDGCNVYFADEDNLRSLLYELHTKPWASQCIQAIYCIPQYLANIEGSKVKRIGTAEIYEANGYKITPSYIKSDGISPQALWDSFKFPERYKNLYKFMTSPYSLLEISANDGTPIILKPECLYHGQLNRKLYGLACGGDVRMALTFPGYNSYNYTEQSVAYGGIGGETPNIVGNDEMLDNALVITNFPKVTVTNNQYLNYIASNRNQIAWQYQQNDWSFNRAYQAAQLAFNQSTMGMETQQKNVGASNAAMWAYNDVNNQRALVSGVEGMVANGISAISGGGVGSVANTAIAGVNMIANTQWNNTNTSISTSLANTQNQNNINQAAYNRDTNYDYALYAAQGDYETNIQGIQAKVQDAQLIQPSVSGQYGGDYFNFVHGFAFISLRFKRLKDNYIREVGDFWLRYGYYVNRWITPPLDLHCMENFTYWKMQSVSIYGNMPEVFKEAIRGIFEKGVTVWRDPNKINRIDLADNEPLGVIKY